MKKHNTYGARILAASTALALFLTGCAGANDAGAKTNAAGLTPVVIAFPTAGADWAAGTLGVAKEYGYLQEYLEPLGYEAVPTAFTGAAPAIHEAMLSGDVDYAYYAGFAGTEAQAGGIPTKLLAVTNYNSTWQLAVSSTSGITSLAELKGKKIAYTRGATPQMYVLKVLEEAGLTQGDVELLNSNLPEGLASLATGAVDAAVVSYGQASSLEAEGKVNIVHEGIRADENTYYEPMVLTGRQEFVEKNEEVTVAILEALLKAKDKIKEDPQAFFALSAERSGLSVAQIQGTALEDLDENYPISLSDSYLAQLEKIVQFQMENKIITNSVDLAQWVDSSYLDKAVAAYQSTQ